MKSFKDLSWDVTEEVYRNDPRLSYSILARYEREGFSKIDHLFDKISTPALTFGSMVDCLITDGMEEFQKRFIVTEAPALPNAIENAVRVLFDMYQDTYISIDSIPNDLIAKIMDTTDWNKHWRLETRVKWVKEHCKQYYELMYISKDKQIVTNDDYIAAIRTYETLKDSETTSWYFEENSPINPNIERFYQLKFKGPMIPNDINGHEYRCMVDEIIVDHERKTIQPIDLKTTGHPEWEFRESFDHWMYQIQARLYWRLIRNIMDKDNEYKKYTLNDYLFICINRYTLCPLVWKYGHTQMIGQVPCLEDKNQTQRDPLTIGEELYNYMQYRPQVPIGIKTGYKEVNDLEING